MAATSTPENLATASGAGQRNITRREAVRKLDSSLQQQAESYLGGTIEPSEWDKAKEEAERKLGRIIDREGDADGTRREPWYLAQLIAEAVRSSRISQFTIDLACLCRYADEQMGLKKEQLA